MKSKKKGLIVFFSLVLIILLLTSNVFATELEVSEYSKKYQEWLELSEEERKGKIAPLPFNVREENTGFFAKLKSYAKSIIIPEKYDLRDDIYVEVKNQQDTGECWAFAANSSVETNLALKNGENKNFSERHVEYDTVLNFLDGINENGFNRKPGNGGTISTAFAYYSRGSGPIPEEYMPFENNENVINLYELPQNVAEKKVDDMIYFPNLLKKHDENGNLMYFDADYNLYTESEVKIIRNKIKEHIMENGGLVTSIVGPNCYYNELTYAANVVDIVDTNHAVTIIGWDDNFPKENFLDQPSEDGAYIVLNSWGEEWGDNGIYYISYEDYNVESWLRGVTSVSDIEYDNLYQHDTNEMAVCFPSITYSANVFESEENEILTEIMIGSLGTQTCNIYYGLDGVLDKDFLTKIASNVELKSGYNTIKLNKEIKIEKGRKFSIVVEEISNSSSAGVGLESNQTIFGNSTNNMGESYISANGYGWSDLYYYEYDKINLSIKAFTKLDKKSFEVSEINGKAYANYGGEFTFSVSTTYEKVGENLKISIYKDDIDVTEQFNFINTEIKGKGSFTKINALESVQRGNYKAIISLDGFEKVDRYFEVDEIDGECIVAEFKDEEFFNWCKNIMKNTISELDNPMRIIALKSEFEKVEELYPYGNIYDITGVEKFTNLKILNIYNTFVSDLSSVEELDKLEELILGRYSSNADISKLLEKENLNIYFLESRDIYAKDIIKPTKNEIELSNPIYQILSTQKDLNIEAYIYYDLFDEFKIGNSMLIADSNNREKAEIELKDGKAVVKLDNTITENRSERIRMIEISLTNEKVWSFVCLAYEVIEGLKDIEKIEINSNPLKLTYIKGEELDLTGGVLEVTYEDGSKTKVKMINEEVTVIGYDKNTLGEQEIKVNYKGFELTFNVIVKNEVTGIKIKSIPEKVKYIKGEELDLTGGILEVTFEDGSKTEVGMTNEEIKVTGYDKEQLGMQKIILEYKGFTETFAVEVTNNIVEMIVKSKPNKTTYIKGEELDLTGAILEVTYEDGSKEQIQITSEMVTGYNKDKLGSQTITVKYKNLIVMFEVEVINNVVGIKIKFAPTKVKYIKGEELDLNGGELEVLYEDGSKGLLFITTDMITGYDKNILGKQTVTVSYKGFTDTFEVEVTNNIVGMNIKSEPNKTIYVKGEELDLTGGILEVKHEDLSKTEIEMTNEEVKATGYNKEQLGMQKIVLEYKGFTETFAVTVKNDVVGIQIKSEPTKVKYIKGEELDLTGGELEIVYENGSKGLLFITTDMITGYDKNTLGKQTVTVSYKGFTDTFEVEVTNNIVGMIIKSKPNKTIYIKGEELDLDGGILEVTFEDGSKTEVGMTNEEVKVTGYNKEQLGTQKIILEYKGFTETFVVEVTNDIVGMTIKTKPNKTTYIKGEELDLTGGVLEVTLENGNKTLVKMTNEEVKVTGYNKEQLGTQKIILEYKGFTETFAVEVTNNIVGIQIKSEPNKVTYIKGEEIDLTGGILEVTYEDGSKIEVGMTNVEVKVTEYEKDILGEQKVIVSYKGFTETFVVIVKNDVTGIQIKSEPAKLKYIKGEEIDLTDGILEVTYEDGSKSEVEMTNEEVKVTGYNKEQLGTQKVVLEYKGFTETFVVTVTNDMVDMVIKTKIDKTTYYVGQELDLTGGILEVIFEDGSKQEIEMTSEEVKVTGYDKAVLGEQEITVNYKEFVVTFKVKVLSDEIIFEKYVPEITEEGNYIEEIYKNETIKDLKDDITTEGTIKIYNKEKEEILEDDVEMATGMTVEIILDDKVVTYEIVVTGDINGDGKVDILDQSILAGYMVQEEKATEIMVGANLRASNIVKDDQFGNILDISKLARVLVGLEEIK